jgi:hypothetical protein
LTIRNPGTNAYRDSRRIPIRDSSNAHCVCVVGKTTVCRIFSCQRSFRGNLAPRKLSAVAGRFPRTPSARSLAGAPKPRAVRWPQNPHALTRSALPTPHSVRTGRATARLNSSLFRPPSPGARDARGFDGQPSAALACQP